MRFDIGNNNMIRIFKGIVKFRVNPMCFFSDGKEETYIPVRPLKEDRNLLFSSQSPSGLSFSGKVLIYTPFMAISLDGFINEWTNWRIFGSLFLLWAGARVARCVNFLKAQEVFALKTNRNLSCFYLTLTNNHFSSKYQEMLLENQKRTFEQKFKENLKNRTLELTEEIYNQLNSASDSQLENSIAFLKSVRQGVIIELPMKSIEKIQFVSERELRKVSRRDLLLYLLNRKEKEMLEEYSALKQPKKFILITTKPFKKWNDRPLHFFLNFQANTEKKYEEYLKALAEGKRIIEP